MSILAYRQYVDFENTKSAENVITTGVPNGSRSILWPLLFIIYINEFICYATDTTLTITLNSVDGSYIRSQINSVKTGLSIKLGTG